MDGVNPVMNRVTGGATFPANHTPVTLTLQCNLDDGRMRAAESKVQSHICIDNYCFYKYVYLMNWATTGPSPVQRLGMFILKQFRPGRHSTIPPSHQPVVLPA